MKARTDLLKYAPDPLIPLILEKIGPNEFKKLCLINEELYDKLKKHMGMSCNVKSLPSLENPRDLYLFKQLFNDDELLMYGTSHIEKVLKLVKGDKRLRTLERLKRKTADRRKTFLKKILKQDRISSKGWGVGDVPKILLNIWISKETFQKYYKFINNQGGGDLEDNLEGLIIKFINMIMEDEDYLVNWGLFPLLLNSSDAEFYHSDEIEQFIRYTIGTLRSQLIKPRVVSQKGTDKYTRTLPAGELFYRGYRTYRGAADKTRNFAWFAFDVVSTMSYLVPPKKEDNKSYLSDTVTFTNLYNYCRGVGGTSAFRVQKDLKLLDFGNVHTLKHLRKIMGAKAPEDVVQAFEHGWEIKGDAFKRYSVDMLDGKVATWLCKNGYDGYIANNVPGLHDEVMICNLSENMKYVGDYDPRVDMNFHMCEKPYSLVDSYIIYW